MLAIAWKEEDKTTPKDHSIRGIVVGKNETTLNEMWRTSTTKPSGRI
jgi:hypothetical protein